MSPTSASWTTTTSYGKWRPITRRAGTQDSKLESIAVCRTELFREIIRKGPNHRFEEEACSMQQFLFLHRKTAAPTFVALRPSECEELSRKGSKEYSVKTTCKIRGTVRKMRHTSKLDSMTGSKTRADPEENSLHTKGIYCADHGTYIDSVLREIYDAYKAARSTPPNCDGGPQTRYRSNNSI